MEKTLLEATCEMHKLRAIQQTKAAEANPSLPVLDPLEKWRLGYLPLRLALEIFIETRAHFPTTGKSFEECISGLASIDYLVNYSMVGVEK